MNMSFYLFFNLFHRNHEIIEKHCALFISILSFSFVEFFRDIFSFLFLKVFSPFPFLELSFILGFATQNIDSVNMKHDKKKAYEALKP